jgi:hypothetical protein
MVQCLLSELHANFSYPREILDFDYDIMEMSAGPQVWDIYNGTILTLSEGAHIVKA